MNSDKMVAEHAIEPNELFKEADRCLLAPYEINIAGFTAGFRTNTYA